MTTNPKRYTVTAALPYANGPVHIGHLAGVYLPADIYVRYLRMQARDVKFICGSDEHGVPITIRAKKEGITPQQAVDKYHELIKHSFEEFNVSFDVYDRTSSAIHRDTASDFFLKLYNDGKFIEQTTEQYYDEGAHQFLADRYITGTCPKCGFEHAYGDQCENCGTSLNATDLINPKSTLSGLKPVLRETKHWYLPLNEYEAWLREWIVEGHKNDWKPNVYGQCKSWIDQGLQPRAVTRDLDWGVPVPLPGAEGKVLYVWFDAPIGYISATKALTDDWEKYWKDEETKLVHFIGKDNIVFHCIIFPAMLKAHGDFILPDNVPANEFLNLEGDKISTSRNWAVWLHEYLQDFPGKADVLRYVLAANMPETKDNDFTWKDYQARNNNELLAILGNFINRAVVLTQKYYEGAVPACKELTDYDKEVLGVLENMPMVIATYIERYRFRDALGELMNLARLGNKYLADTEPWKLIKTDAERVKTIMNIALQISGSVAMLMEPFLPASAAKLRDMLQMKAGMWADAGAANLLPAGHVIGKPELLFEKVEDAAVDAQVQKLLDTKIANEAANVANATVEPAKEDITFEDFSKMDIRVGTIIEAEKVAKTKKLLKLKIDTGLDQRTVVSGIAEFFNPEEIIGQQVSILVNLAPRDIKGITSQGMILMAENADGSLAFMQPGKQIKNGGTVS
ncbi:methionine--tRNA ligase [Pontibacter chitinilyticus]|uniref:methionine--tRNA ligase n=1 Tax=Pontibacter chitinilyticus TaxID=2674989 RepID=UPI00321B3AFE